MKKLLFLALLGIVSIGCCVKPNAPAPPYGTPDTKSDYVGADGYESIEYDYNCITYNGAASQWVGITYTIQDKCSQWEKTSVYVSSGICP